MQNYGEIRKSSANWKKSKEGRKLENYGKIRTFTKIQNTGENICENLGEIQNSKSVKKSGKLGTIKTLIRKT